MLPRNLYAVCIPMAELDLLSWPSKVYAGKSAHDKMQWALMETGGMLRNCRGHLKRGGKRKTLHTCSEC